LNYVYELPFGKGKTFGSGMNRAIEDAIAGGWQVSGITHVQSGFPLSINANNNSASLWGGNQHANLTGAAIQGPAAAASGSKATAIPVGKSIASSTRRPFRRRPHTPSAADHATFQPPGSRIRRRGSDSPGKWFNLVEIPPAVRGPDVQRFQPPQFRYTGLRRRRWNYG
jgi:hypothetical protein